MNEIIDRSPPGLVDALCRRIKSVLSQSFWYPGEFEEYHTPYVHAQYLPVSKTESEERDESKDYPIVLVICDEGNISDFSEAANGSEISIQIFFGGYSNDTDNQGWRIPAAMLWRVLQDLLADTILGGYQLTVPINWYASNDNDIIEPPYYTAMMKTKWKGRAPAIETPFEGVTALSNESEEKSEDA